MSSSCITALDGPTHSAQGAPRQEALLASADQVAIDVVAAKLMGMDPMRDCRFVRQHGAGREQPHQYGGGVARF